MADPRVDLVAFTGSWEVGAQIFYTVDGTNPTIVSQIARSEASLKGAAAKAVPKELLPVLDRPTLDGGTIGLDGIERGLSAEEGGLAAGAGAEGQPGPVVPLHRCGGGGPDRDVAGPPARPLGWVAPLWPLVARARRLAPPLGSGRRASRS